MHATLQRALFTRRSVHWSVRSSVHPFLHQTLLVFLLYVIFSHFRSFSVIISHSKSFLVILIFFLESHVSRFSHGCHFTSFDVFLSHFKSFQVNLSRLRLFMSRTRPIGVGLVFLSSVVQKNSPIIGWLLSIK